MTKIESKKILPVVFLCMVLSMLVICIAPFMWGSPPPYYSAVRMDSMLWNPNTEYGMHALLHLGVSYGWYEELFSTSHGLESRGISFFLDVTRTDIREAPISMGISFTYPLPHSDLFCLFAYGLGNARFYCKVSYPNPPPAANYLFDFDTSD